MVRRVVVPDVADLLTRILVRVRSGLKYGKGDCPFDAGRRLAIVNGACVKRGHRKENQERALAVQRDQEGRKERKIAVDRLFSPNERF